MTGGEAKLSPRTTIHTGYNFSATEMSKLYFSGLYMNSAISSEVMIGSIYQQYLNFYEKKACYFDDTHCSSVVEQSL
jgi:hypothetical protein